METGKGYMICYLSVIFLLFPMLIAFDAHADIIIDNRDAATSQTGFWDVSNGANQYGADSVFGRNGATFTWHFTAPQSGNYAVSMWWTYRDTRSTGSPVDIEHSGGTARVFVNQQRNGGIWNVLDTYAFEAGVSYKITITAAPTPTSAATTCADAVKFVYVSGGGNTPPVAVIDSISPNPALPGQAVTFTGHGTDSDGSIAAYEWQSSIGGLLGTENTFTTSSLAAGSHTISFRVQDNNNAWSAPVTRVLVVGSPASQTIIDNRDAATSQAGFWDVSNGANQYGADSVFGRNGATFAWYFTAPQGGNYEVSMWWTYRDTRSTGSPVDIEHSGGTARVFVNQQQNGGIWNVLGTYAFEAGVSYRITITAAPTPTSAATTCADAVKFVYVSGGGNTPPVAVIDSISPNPALPGQAVSFTGHGTDSDGSITGYSWRSSTDGFLSAEASFSTSALSEGIHVIYFKVQDDKGTWSPEVSRILGHRGCASPFKIMPLGDSITYGTYGVGDYRPEELITGYRQLLYQALSNAGYYVDFAGSLQAGESVSPLFDYDHEGHPGWSDDQVADYVYQWLVDHPADVILLHIGTNALDPSPLDVEDILNEIDRYSEDITVILARIINWQTNNPVVTEFNDNVEATARSRIAAGDKIIIVDQENALSYPGDMADLVHPNDAGYIKMANIWFNALKSFLPICEQFPPSIISSTAGDGGSISPAGAIPVRYGSDQTFIITSSAGYHIVDVIVDGSLLGAIPLYTFPAVTANHIIEAMFVPDLPPLEITIDNRDAATSWTGFWDVSNGANQYGADSVFGRNGVTFTWHFTAPQGGNYEVSMWWTYRDTRSTSSPVDIEYSGGTGRVFVNQKQIASGGTWNVLGTYAFEAGVSYKITITAAPTPTSAATTCADAVKFVFSQ